MFRRPSGLHREAVLDCRWRQRHLSRPPASLSRNGAPRSLGRSAAVFGAPFDGLPCRVRWSRRRLRRWSRRWHYPAGAPGDSNGCPSGRWPSCRQFRQPLLCLGGNRERRRCSELKAIACLAVAESVTLMEAVMLAALNAAAAVRHRTGGLNRGVDVSPPRFRCVGHAIQIHSLR